VAPPGVDPRVVHVSSDFIAAVDSEMGEHLLGDKADSSLLGCSKLKRLVPGFRKKVPFLGRVTESVELLRADPTRRMVDPKLDQTIERILTAWQEAIAAAL